MRGRCLRPKVFPGKTELEKSDYDCFAEQFDATRKTPWKEVIDFFGGLGENSTVLDVGCGNGRHMIEAKRLGLNIFGIDKSKKLSKIARKKTSLPIIIGDARMLPFKSYSFENSVCIAVVHHFGDERERIACFKEIARVSRKEILVSVWAFEQEKFAKRKSSRSASAHSKLSGSSSDKSQDIQLGWNREHPRFYHLFRNGELAALAKKAGLGIKRIWREGNNYWIRVKK